MKLCMSNASKMYGIIYTLCVRFMELLLSSSNSQIDLDGKLLQYRNPGIKSTSLLKLMKAILMIVAFEWLLRY